MRRKAIAESAAADNAVAAAALACAEAELPHPESDLFSVSSESEPLGGTGGSGSVRSLYAARNFSARSVSRSGAAVLLSSKA